MGRNRKNTYREVDTLPKNAVTPDVYAAEKGYSNLAAIYNGWSRKVKPEQEREDGNPEKAMKELGYEIVVFRGINFVLPKKTKKPVI